MAKATSAQKTAVGLTELHLEGFIHFPTSSQVELTDKGVDYAYALFHGLAPKDSIALTLLVHRMDEVLDEEDAADSEEVPG